MQKKSTLPFDQYWVQNKSNFLSSCSFIKNLNICVHVHVTSHRLTIDDAGSLYNLLKICFGTFFWGWRYFIFFCHDLQDFDKVIEALNSGQEVDLNNIPPPPSDTSNSQPSTSKAASPPAAAAASSSNAASSPSGASGGGGGSFLDELPAATAEG